MMKLQENSKQLSFLIICFSQKPTFEVLSANLKTLTANKLCILVQLVIRGVRPNPTNPPWIRPWSTSPHTTLLAEIYKPTFKTLTGSSSASESWKETTRKSKENSSPNAVKWRQSAKRVEWAFPHGQPTPSPDFRARSVHTGFHNYSI